jgi:hypothetical protein
MANLKTKLMASWKCQKNFKNLKTVQNTKPPCTGYLCETIDKQSNGDAISSPHHRAALIACHPLYLHQFSIFHFCLCNTNLYCLKVCILALQLLEWLETSCLVTVFLETLSIWLPGWSLVENVRMPCMENSQYDARLLK